MNAVAIKVGAPESLPAENTPLDAAALAVRKARIGDIHALLALINGYAANGVMLPRTEFEMAENIRDFTVVYDGEYLAACGALHFYTPIAAEVRSLAVDPRIKRRGMGRIIVEALESEARGNDLHAIFAFTYVPDFFRKLGFVEVDRGALPLKAWKDCLRCPKFQSCDEIAVLKPLQADVALDPAPPIADLLVQLPRVRR